MMANHMHAVTEKDDATIKICETPEFYCMKVVLYLVITGPTMRDEHLL
jgi:hypothetical protein